MAQGELDQHLDAYRRELEERLSPESVEALTDLTNRDAETAYMMWLVRQGYVEEET